MELKTLIESRNTLFTQMQAISTGEKFDVEQRTKFDTMNADLATLDGDIVRLKAVEKYAAEQRAVVLPKRDAPGAAIEPTVDEVEERKVSEKRSFDKFMRTGVREARDITTATTGANGGALVPQLYHNVLTDALKYFGPIATIVGQKRTTGGQPLKIGLSNDTSNGLAIIGETVAPAETDPTYVSQILSTDTVTPGMVKISLQELADSAFDLEAWLRTKFGQRYGRGLEATVTNGNGSNVASLVAAAHAAVTALGNTNHSGSDGANSIGYADIAALYAALDPAYIANATWLMNSNTRGLLMGVTDTLGRPLFVANPSSGGFDTLLGRPVVIDQALPNIAASAVGTVLFGDFAAGYMLRTDGDLEIVRLNERFMDQLEVGFLGYARVGGISMDAGTHPIIKLTQSAT